MHWSKLDFAVRRPLVTPSGAALLLLGIGLAASVTFDALDALARRDTAQQKLAQLSARAAELRGAKVQQLRVAAKDAGRGNAPDEREARRIAEAQKVIRTLATPWDEMFDALETAQDDSVALLSIAPERAAGRLAMSGEAKLRSADRLAGTPRRERRSAARAIARARDQRQRPPHRFYSQCEFAQMNLKTAFNTENTEKNTENTESSLETTTHSAGELKLYLCALCASVFSVLKALATRFSG